MTRADVVSALICAATTIIGLALLFAFWVHDRYLTWARRHGNPERAWNPSLDGAGWRERKRLRRRGRKIRERLERTTAS